MTHTREQHPQFSAFAASKEMDIANNMYTHGMDKPDEGRIVLLDTEYDIYTEEGKGDDVDLTGRCLHFEGKRFMLIRSDASDHERTVALDTVGWM